MNEWDRLHRQAERYKAEYPSGTRIMLLSMGEDIHRRRSVFEYTETAF